ncbi:carboxylesterase 1F-like [Mytilus californianus]|uniref:carboxylesterase 1F-like n=1 Tax=Mytilus californianus TaxID=6549 RepID=UPI002246D75B|nr:carboxylesterase 1F-like [Mytilus californianus]
MEMNYNEFRNIPFAKPPVGGLRFHQPVPYGSWSDIYDATRFGPSCIQSVNGIVDQYVPNTNTSEDCLVLNIYVPSGFSESNAKSVIIWVHGGGYYLGQGMFYDGSYLSGIGDVIVVTINYRLGVFGFFSTMDDVALGNYGLWDQQMAIKWVHDNIESFGGDPNSVTIAGQSAGAFSVALQALNPANKGLFHRVIAQSGARM